MVESVVMVLISVVIGALNIPPAMEGNKLNAATAILALIVAAMWASKLF